MRKGLDTPDAKQLSLFNFRRVCTIIGKSGSDEQVLERFNNWRHLPCTFLLRGVVPCDMQAQCYDECV